jgi:hypothetical protein
MSGTASGDEFVCVEEDCWIYTHREPLNTAHSFRIRVGTIVQVTKVHEEGLWVKMVRNDVHEAEHIGFCHHDTLSYFKKM